MTRHLKGEEDDMKTKIILLLVLLLIGLGDWSEHHFTCAAEEAQLLPISYTDEEIGRKEKKKPADTKRAEEKDKTDFQRSVKTAAVEKESGLTGFPERAWKEKGRRNPIRGSYAAKEGTWGKEGPALRPWDRQRTPFRRLF